MYQKCSNTFCDGKAEKIGGLCAECQRKADEAQKRQKSLRWLWAGFDKTTDNHRKGYKKP